MNNDETEPPTDVAAGADVDVDVGEQTDEESVLSRLNKLKHLGRGDAFLGSIASTWSWFKQSIEDDRVGMEVGGDAVYDDEGEGSDEESDAGDADDADDAADADLQNSSRSKRRKIEGFGLEDGPSSTTSSTNSNSSSNSSSNSNRWVGIREEVTTEPRKDSEKVQKTGNFHRMRFHNYGHVWPIDGTRELELNVNQLRKAVQQVNQVMQVSRNEGQLDNMNAEEDVSSSTKQNKIRHALRESHTLVELKENLNWLAKQIETRAKMAAMTAEQGQKNKALLKLELNSICRSVGLDFEEVDDTSLFISNLTVAIEIIMPQGDSEVLEELGVEIAFDDDNMNDLPVFKVAAQDIRQLLQSILSLKISPHTPPVMEPSLVGGSQVPTTRYQAEDGIDFESRRKSTVLLKRNLYRKLRSLIDRSNLYLEQSKIDPSVIQAASHREATLLSTLNNIYTELSVHEDAIVNAHQARQMGMAQHGAAGVEVAFRMRKLLYCHANDIAAASTTAAASSSSNSNVTSTVNKNGSTATSNPHGRLSEQPPQLVVGSQVFSFTAYPLGSTTLPDTRATTTMTNQESSVGEPVSSLKFNVSFCPFVCVPVAVAERVCKIGPGKVESLMPTEKLAFNDRRSADYLTSFHRVVAATRAKIDLKETEELSITHVAQEMTMLFNFDPISRCESASSSAAASVTGNFTSPMGQETKKPKIQSRKKVTRHLAEVARCDLFIPEDNAVLEHNITLLISFVGAVSLFNSLLGGISGGTFECPNYAPLLPVRDGSSKALATERRCSERNVRRYRSRGGSGTKQSLKIEVRGEPPYKLLLKIRKGVQAVVPSMKSDFLFILVEVAANPISSSTATLSCSSLWSDQNEAGKVEMDGTHAEFQPCNDHAHRLLRETHSLPMLIQYLLS